MVALRKRYEGRILEADDAPPVMTPPVNGAQLPPAVEAKKPEASPVEIESEAELASKNAIRDRIREMEHAEGLAKQAVQQQQRFATEQQQDPVEAALSNSGLPDRAKTWLRAHPEYLTDQEKNAELQHFHWKARREAEEFSDGYYTAIERLLGLRQMPSAPAPQHSAPARPAQTPRVAMSAPPSRDVPSFSSGRPRDVRTSLTPAQREAAQFSGISDEEYRRQLEKVEREKAAGLHQNG